MRSETVWSWTGTRRSKIRLSPTKSVSTVSFNMLVEYRILTTAVDLSLEFLMGRALDNAMLNVGKKDAARGTMIHG